MGPAMETMTMLAKGALQYAPSYTETLVEFLSGPIAFLRKVLTSDNKEEELKRAFSFAFLTILLTALLLSPVIGVSNFPQYFIMDVALKILQVCALTACMHFALRLVSIQVPQPIIITLSLYFVSFLYIAMLLGFFAGFNTIETPNELAIFGVLVLGYIALYWTSLRQALQLSWSKTVISLVVFFGLYFIVGSMFWKVVQGMRRSYWG
jgi:hypothetical protein